MKKHTSNPLQYRLSAIAIACTCALSPALKAQESQTAEPDEKVIEKIFVTGSRIASDTNLFSSVPVQGIDEKDIRLSGELNLADVVNDIPALISSVTGENSTTGANELNLRGLGGERTLTLVNGRRHVAGFRGTQAVDIGTIPRALVKRVEVTTGGASAVYGADAVTGVVNFILMDDYEGLQIDARAAVPDAPGGQNQAIDILFGQNFDEDRGNIVFALTLEEDNPITFGQRSWARDNGIASIRPRANPDPNGPPQAVIEDPRFWLTSQEGSIAPGFGGRNITYVDINNNGIPDCQESEAGRTGFLAGCWLTNPDGSVRVNQDGTVLNGLWGIGGDGGRLNFNRDYLAPETDRIVFNVNGSYDFNDDLRGFFEAKYVRATSTNFNEQDSFFDTLFIQPDNPFIPSQLLPVVEQTGGLLLTQDPLDWSDDNKLVYTRETTRFVAGLEWNINEDHTVELSFNHGRFTNTSDETGIYWDRVFSAIDAVRGPDGNIVCRSDIDPTAAYEIDYFAAGGNFADGGFSTDRYYTFTPGDGQCAPLNPFGTYSTSAEARDFVTARLRDELELEQTVVALISSGQFEVLDSVLDGPIGYAAGLEYREESSVNTLDPLRRGVLPQGTSFTPGVLVSEVSPWLNALIGLDNTQQFNTSGEYDVTDIFAEVRLPIFLDRDFARELTVDGAFRVADYSTLGSTETWKLGFTYSPIEDITLRSTLSEAVRAPNIAELFDPRLPIFVNADEDPCDFRLVGSGTSARQANCTAALQAAGVAQAEIVDGQGNYIWQNPLTARFPGVSGGNPNLDVETAETVTVGIVLQPSFIEGFSITLDYWDIEIQDAISAVGATQILQGCYDSQNFPNLGFCDQFTRRADGGLNSLETGQINFARQEARGIDFAVYYDITAGENEFNFKLVGSRQDRLDFYFNPLDDNDVNPELEEVRLPELTANFTIGWQRGPMSLSLQTLYQGRQSVDEIEDVLGLAGNQALYGANGFFGETYVFDINGSYEINEGLSVYGGVNNITDEEPFATQTAWPVGPRGRTFFFGISYRN